jgi:tetratricopeptide (TPR) repeat protein
MFARALTLVFVVAVVAAGTGVAQTSRERERARPHYRSGWQFMRAEAWPDAAKSFQQAIDIDPQFEDAYYSLGRAYMSMKRFADAIAAYAKSRDLYRSYAGQHYSNQQEMQRSRQDRLLEIDQIAREFQTGPQTMQTQERRRQLNEQRRQIQDLMQRGANITIENSVPAFVVLALGSAYFRSGNLADAEREYKAAIAIDPKSGEAHNNLAVVYLETGRYADAERSVAAAEKAGHTVNPQLKQDIKDKKKGT